MDTLSYFQFYNNIHLLLLSFEHAIQILRIRKVLQSFTDTNIDFHTLENKAEIKNFPVSSIHEDQQLLTTTLDHQPLEKFRQASSANMFSRIHADRFQGEFRIL